MTTDKPAQEILNDVELTTFQEAVEHAGHAVYWTDPEGVIEYVNPAFEKQTEYTAEEAIGRNANILQSGVHDDAFYGHLWNTILNGEVWNGEIVNECKSGDRYVVKQTISPITDETGDIIRFVAINEEITELRAYQDRLERERDRLNTLLDAVPTPIVLVRFTDTEPVVRRVNPAFEDVFGLSNQQLAGSSLDEYISTGADASQARKINDLLRQGESVRREVTRETATGDTRTFILEATPLTDGDDSVEEALATYLDITERKRADRKRTLLTEVSQSIGTADTFEDGLEQTLKTICTYTDWCCGEVWQPVSGDDHLEFVVGYATGSDCETFLTASESVRFPVGDGLPGRVYASGSPEWIPDVSQEPPDVFHRSEVAKEVSLRAGVGVPVTASEEVVAVLVFFLQESRASDEKFVDDIADVAANLGGLVARKHAEEMVKRRNERLEDFASVLSHDLRNPLSVAMAHLELIDDECESPHIDAVETAHARIQELIDDMLTLARQGKTADENEQINLVTCLNQCWRALDTANATLNVETTQTISGDESRVRQLLENLFRNAIEHGADDVTITVGELIDGFYVADNGPGIPVDERADVFDVGYTTHKSGTGFGLPIVKEIVEAHGWNIAVTESKDGGARFEITGVEHADE